MTMATLANGINHLYSAVANALSPAVPPSIDPVTAVFALAMATKFPLGSKPSLTNKCITYDLPGDDQAGIRAGKGVSHNDLGALITPLRLSIKFWKHLPAFQEMLQKSLEGLEMITKSYALNAKVYHSSHLLFGTLRDYSNIIKEALQNPIEISADQFTEVELRIKGLWNENTINICQSAYTESDHLATLQSAIDTQQLKYVTLLSTLQRGTQSE